MIGIVALIIFVVAWVGLATLARRFKQSWTIALGGGFVGSLVVLIGVANVALPKRDKSSPQAAAVASEQSARMPASPDVSSALRQKELYNPSIPAAEREAQIRRLLAGQQFHGVTLSGYENYTLTEDGTRLSTHCIPYGEVSERKFAENTPGQWRVKEMRYRDTGKIYYFVTVQESDQFPVPELLVDREQGLLIYNGGDPPSRPEPGHNTTYCGT